MICHQESLVCSANHTRLHHMPLTMLLLAICSTNKKLFYHFERQFVSYSKPNQAEILPSGVRCLLVSKPRQDYTRATSDTTYDATSTAKKATSNTRQLNWITSKIWQHSPPTFCHLESVVFDANQRP